MPANSDPLTANCTATAISRSQTQLRNDQTGRSTAFRQLVYVGENQIVEGRDEQHHADKSDARDRGDAIGRDDQYRDADRIEKIRYRQRIDRFVGSPWTACVSSTGLSSSATTVFDGQESEDNPARNRNGTAGDVKEPHQEPAEGEQHDAVINAVVTIRRPMARCVSASKPSFFPGTARAQFSDPCR